MVVPFEKRRAFTLVELLVVIGIIALLIGFLMPALTRAREQSKATVCLSNMRQIGSGLMMYVQDYDETFPYCQFHGIDALLATHAYVLETGKVTLSGTGAELSRDPDVKRAYLGG